MSQPPLDALSALLLRPRWVRRRVDRVEFLDLTTVHRTIVFTLDLDELREALPSKSEYVPLGWFASGARAGARLVDAKGLPVSYLGRAASDKEVSRYLKRRLRALGISPRGLEQIPRHRDDAASGYAELAKEKWGCPHVARILEQLRAHDPQGTKADLRTRQLVQILLAWQTNFVLFAQCDSGKPPPSWATLRLTYDEELTEWLPPWERRLDALGCDDLPPRRSRERRAHISRGGPFQQHLDGLLPPRFQGFLARRRNRWLSRVGRRGLLGLAWHVAWHQASGRDMKNHSVEVVLPAELTAVRIRMLRMKEKTEVAVADQLGTRAAIVAPEPAKISDGSTFGSSTLFSLVVVQCGPEAWRGGALLASVTGAAILAVAATSSFKTVVAHGDWAVTSLLVAPVLVSAALSVRAASAITGQLTGALRRLIALVGVTAVVCAIALVMQRGAGTHHPTGFCALQVLWLVAGCLLIGVAGALATGAHRINRHIAYARRPAARDRREETLSPSGAPRIPPPDRLIQVVEGDLVPWGWFDGPGSPQAPSSHDGEDQWFWNEVCAARKQLVAWVREVVEYSPPAPPHVSPRPRRGPIRRLLDTVRPPRC